MKLKGLFSLGLFFVLVLFSYGTSNAQVVDVVKDAAKKTKDVTVDAAKKTVDVTKDVYDKADDAAAKAGKTTVNIAGKTYDVADDIAYETANGTKKAIYYTGDKAADLGKMGYKGGKWVTVTVWDGTKWVAKKAQFWTKEAINETEDVLN